MKERKLPRAEAEKRRRAREVSRHRRRRPRPGRLAIAHSTTFGATPRDPPMAHVGTAPVPPSVAHWPHHISAAVSENPGLPNARAAPSLSTACMGHGTSRASLSDLRQYILTPACVRPVRRTGNKTSSSWGRVTPRYSLLLLDFLGFLRDDAGTQ
eukprot:954083-Prymnesium_polylepis.1